MRTACKLTPLRASSPHARALTPTLYSSAPRSPVVRPALHHRPPAFQCDDDFGEDGASFLIADYGTSCVSAEYENFIRPWAVIGVAVYPVSVNLFYAIILWRHRDAAYLRFLTDAYSSRCNAWEPVDSVRRCAMIGLLVFFGTQSQLLVGVLLAFSFQLLYLYAEPYQSLEDARVSAIANGQITFTLLLLVARRGYRDISPEIETALGLACILANLVVVPVAVAFQLRDVKRRFDVMRAIEHGRIEYVLRRKSTLEQTWRAGTGSRRLLREKIARCVQEFADGENIVRLLSLPVFCNSNFDDTSLGIVYERAPAVDSREHRLLTLQPSTDDEIEMPSQRPSLSRLLSDNSVAIAAEDEAAASEEEPELEFAILEPSAVTGPRESRDRFEYAVIEEEQTDADPESRALLIAGAHGLPTPVTVDWDAQTLLSHETRRPVAFDSLLAYSMLKLARQQPERAQNMLQQAAGRGFLCTCQKLVDEPTANLDAASDDDPRTPREIGKASADPAVREFFSQVGSYESRYVLQTGRPLRRTAKFDLIAAKDIETNNPVVVKTMREASHHARELDARGWEQHGGEWSPPPSERALSSAYVLPVLDVHSVAPSVEMGSNVLILPHFEQSLDQAIGSEFSPGINATAARRVLKRVAEALSHIHDRGVIHCNLRPRNGECAI